jgi:fido (protein-threonine AMPylation protein)
MRNDYQYIDPDYIYTDPKTGVLRNLAGITDGDALVFAETAATTKRAGELKADPVKTKDSNAEVYERYMTGTINGDADALAKLIFECLSK